jgi:hypothetical protein
MEEVELELEELEDEDLMLEYNKSIYKYSGGTNLEALNNTLRSDFK